MPDSAETGQDSVLKLIEIFLPSALCYAKYMLFDFTVEYHQHLN